MTFQRTAQYLRIGLALSLVLTVGALAGCTGAKTATPTDTSLAKSAFAVALSSLSTTAPDGKLLVTQSAGTLTATSTPVWEFLIGSPKTDQIYAVLVKNGKAQSSPYSKAGLSAADWAAVPDASAWKVDSKEALDKALAVYPNGKTSGRFMGFVTFLPKTATKTASKPMTWIISFDPATQGKATTSTVNVDLTTGVAALAK